MNEQTNDDSVVYWDKLTGNKFNRAINPVMTLGAGWTIPSNVRIEGESKFCPATLKRVYYDRNYVVAKVANDFVRPLSRLPYNEVQAIFTDAWRLVKDEG